MSDKDAYIKKHQKLTSIVCCPDCHGDLIYPDGDFYLDIPVASRVVCNQCGEVGQVSNMKFLLTPEDLPSISTKGAEYTGELSINPLPLSPDFFTPNEMWNINGDQFWSSNEQARFSIQCDALALSLIFLKHPWAGVARIMLDGKELGVIDLFEEKGSINIWYPIYLDENKHIIKVEVTGKKNPDSNDAQVFLLGAEVLELKPSIEPKIVYENRNDGNPYPELFKTLIADVDNEGLILDCGSGDRNYPDSRVINFEYSRFRSPDIFGDGHKLPFKDNSFDLILSQAVIEHLYDPSIAVEEILRVLKPGGVVYAESAFMQPLHAVPFHFFNTTGWGLEQLFKNFEILKIGHEGQLTDTLTWFYNLTSLRDKGFGNKVDELLASVKELDQHISHEELKYFSSYVTLLAKKPEVD